MPPGGSAATPAGDVTHPADRSQRFSPTKRLRYPPRRGLSPPHKTLLLGSPPEIGPSGAPRTLGDDTRTALSSAANLTPRHTPAAAGRSAPESPRTAGGAPPPPPAGTRGTSRATRPSPRS